MTYQRGKKRIKFTPLLLVTGLLLMSLVPVIRIGQAEAAGLTQVFVRLDRLKATTPTGGRICAKPATASVEASVNVTFPTTSATDFTVNATAANWTVTTTQLDTGQTAWPGIATATAVSGKTVTFPSTDLVVGTLYCFNFSGTNTLTTSSAGAPETVVGTVTTRTTTPTDIDSGNYDIAVISDDQVVVTAVVPPSFTFVLDGNTAAFTTNLSTSAVVSTVSRTITITTNAASGWIVWAKDLNDNGSGRGSLRSATASNYNIAGSVAPGSASRTLSTAVEDYGLGVSVTNGAGAGTPAVNANYDGSANKAGTLDPTQFRPIASSNGVGTTDTVVMNNRATITGSTPAANDYTDTMTLVGAGVY